MRHRRVEPPGREQVRRPPHGLETRADAVVSRVVDGVGDVGHGTGGLGELHVVHGILDVGRLAVGAGVGDEVALGGGLRQRAGRGQGGEGGEELEKRRQERVSNGLTCQCFFVLKGGGMPVVCQDRKVGELA